jgi:hypothetical protein
MLRHRPSLHRLAFLGLALTFLLPELSGAAKPTVAVQFELVDPAYRAQLGAAQGAAAETELASFLVADKLGREIGFLDFSLEPSEYTLRVSLGSAGANTAFSSVDFHLATLETPGSAGASALEPEVIGSRIVPVIKAIDRGTSVEDFLVNRSSFVARMKTELEMIDFADLVPELFSQVPVAAGESRLIPTGLQTEPVAWIIPYRREDLCMDVGSEIAVRARMPAGGLGLREAQFSTVAKQPYDPPPGALPAELELLRFRLLCFPPRDQVDLDLLESSAPEQVTVDAIFVTLYFPMGEACGGSISPEDLIEAGGGS